MGERGYERDREQLRERLRGHERERAATGETKRAATGERERERSYGIECSCGITSSKGRENSLLGGKEGSYGRADAGEQLLVSDQISYGSESSCRKASSSKRESSCRKSSSFKRESSCKR